MEIPLNARVECTDGVYGRLICVLINPVAKQLTRLVVKEDAFPNEAYMVSIEFVTETIVDTIRLNCNKAKLETMDPFIKTTYIESKVPWVTSAYRGGAYTMGYYTSNITSEILEVENQQIPLGELAVRRNTRVEATDGYIGHVDEFVINPENGHITQLVMREGHLWGKKDVIIPLPAMSEMGESSRDTLLLKLNKHQVETLPNIPLHRLWS